MIAEQILICQYCWEIEGHAKNEDFDGLVNLYWDMNAITKSPWSSYPLSFRFEWSAMVHLADDLAHAIEIRGIPK
jgi:hypothetical protein